jgi:hypothetical protein
MGAVTALMHADRDPSIAGLVLDSPFTSLRTLAEELAKTYSKVRLQLQNPVDAIVLAFGSNTDDPQYRAEQGQIRHQQLEPPRQPRLEGFHSGFLYRGIARQLHQP